MSEQEQAPEAQDQGTGEQEYVVEWTRNGDLERVVCRGTSAEDRAREWRTKMEVEADDAECDTRSRPEDTSAQYPAAVHVGGPTVTLRLGPEYQDLTKDRVDVASTFFDGANAHERANEFAARAKERAY